MYKKFVNSLQYQWLYYFHSIKNRPFKFCNIRNCREWYRYFRCFYIYSLFPKKNATTNWKVFWMCRFLLNFYKKSKQNGRFIKNMMWENPQYKLLFSKRFYWRSAYVISFNNQLCNFFLFNRFWNFLFRLWLSLSCTNCNLLMLHVLKYCSSLALCPRYGIRTDLNNN